MKGSSILMVCLLGAILVVANAKRETNMAAAFVGLQPDFVSAISRTDESFTRSPYSVCINNATK